MTTETKLFAITALIETGREADKIIQACADAIGVILGDSTLGDRSIDHIFALIGDPTAEECARDLLAQAEGRS